jgi:hypothetical protein
LLLSRHAVHYGDAMNQRHQQVPDRFTGARVELAVAARWRLNWLPGVVVARREAGDDGMPRYHVKTDDGREFRFAHVMSLRKPERAA